MKKRILITAAVLCCFVVVYAAIADANGKWSSVFNSPDGSQYPLTYTFKIDGNKLIGTLDVAGMSVPVDSGMVKDDSIKYSVSVQGADYIHKGKYFATGDSISMDVFASGAKVHMTMKRAQ